MTRGVVVVFGGTGFLGSRVVAELLSRGARVRVAARRPGSPVGAEAVRADLRDATAVGRALRDARAVINAVSLYVEQGDRSFDSIHVAGAGRVARLAAEAGVERLAHVSGIGADARAASRYVRARGEGEARVRDAFGECAILRPSVLFGAGDAFVAVLDAITRVSPVFPLFGDGTTQLAPVHVDDAARALCELAVGDPHRAGIFEIGGARQLSYRECVQAVLRVHRRRRLLLPVPFALWRAAAAALAWMPSPPITADQVALMREHNLPDPARPGFEALGIRPRGLDDALAESLESH